MKIDCGELILGKEREGYAHEYDSWLTMFRLLAFAEEPIECANVPSCWVPFILWLGHEVANVKRVGHGDWDFELLDWRKAYEKATDKRRIVEIASTCRPELVHALYCADTEWPCNTRLASEPLFDAFTVTCNGSFFRREIQEYRELLHGYVPSLRRAVICPCSAEKPYPASLHRAIRKVIPDDWQIIVATGVLGLAPDDLWGKMPEYDSGLPYIERVADTVAWYFSRHEYEHVVVYSDFYAYAVRKGFRDVATPRIPRTIDYILGNHYRDTYENLLLPEHLHALERTVTEVSERVYE